MANLKTQRAQARQTKAAASKGAQNFMMPVMPTSLEVILQNEGAEQLIEVLQNSLNQVFHAMQVMQQEHAQVVAMLERKLDEQNKQLMAALTKKQPAPTLKVDALQAANSARPTAHRFDVEYDDNGRVSGLVPEYDT